MAPKKSHHDGASGTVATRAIDIELEELPDPDQGEAYSAGSAHADRRVRGAAASLGAIAGGAVSGPVGAVALAATAAYVTTRENQAGRVLRKASSVYLQAADNAVDRGLKVADQAFDEGCRQVAKKLREVDKSGMPQPVRAGLRQLSESLQAADAPSPEERAAEVEETRKMREKFPDRVPVLCERSRYSELPELDRKKMVVPAAMTCGEFKFLVHKQVVQAMPRSAEKTIYIFVNGVAPKTSTPLRELYGQLGKEPGFLRVTYGAENTLG